MGDEVYQISHLQLPTANRYCYYQVPPIGQQALRNLRSSLQNVAVAYEAS